MLIMYGSDQTPIYCQAVQLKPLISSLVRMRYQGVICGRTYDDRIIEMSPEGACENYRQNYLWNKNRLYINLDGTGRLYSIDTVGQLSRVDKSCFEGYSFGSFVFSYKDTIFSLGGYGFWHLNGMLRYFNEKIGGWEAVKTNKTVPLQLREYSKAYYDVYNSKIYVIYQNVHPEYLNVSRSDEEKLFVQILDLENKKWLETPLAFNSNLPNISAFLYPGLFHSKFGLIMPQRKGLVVYDFANNRSYLIKKQKADSIYTLYHDFKINWLFFAHDENLVAFDPKTGFWESVTLTEKDLIETNTPIFTKKHKFVYPNRFQIVFGILLFVLIVSGIIIRYQRQRIKRLIIQNIHANKKNNISFSIENYRSFEENLTEIERSLLNVLIKNSKENKMTTAIQINTVLGVKDKNPQIQNNIRSNTINEINRKFVAFSDLSDDLIIKRRTEFDKRMFEYGVELKYLKKIK